MLVNRDRSCLYHYAGKRWNKNVKPVERTVRENIVSCTKQENH
jgi:hypothetical protein